VFAWSNLYKTIIFACIIALLFSPPVQIDSLWWRELINSGHTVLFIFLSIIFYWQIKAIAPDTNVLIIYLCVIVLAVLLGIVIEALQTMVHREASLNDIYRNFYGVMTGICLHACYAVINKHHNKLIAVLVITGSAGFLLTGMLPLMRMSWHYVERANAFPVVMNFESDWAASFIQYNKGVFPGVSIIEPEPDWSGFHALHLRINSVNEHDIKLALRVHDKRHNQDYSDRFNIKLSTHPGFNEYLIPLDEIRHGPTERELDLKSIAGIILFSDKGEEWMKIKVSNISLE
jgi:hypothetical protein